jgi:hypothetical protein
MTANAARLRTVTGVLGLVVVGWFLTGRAAQPVPNGLPTDWSHQHVIFSQPGSAAQVGRVANEPRYWQQWVRQNVVRVLAEDDQALRPPIFPRRSGQSVQGDWSENLGSGASVGAGNYPAKFGFRLTTATCSNAASPDYVVFGTGLTGSSSHPSVVGFDNLYSGCISLGGVPTVYWAYNTGGQILTSPVISDDGTQVAFVQTDVALEGTLVLLKWAASSGTLSAPVTLTPVANSAYRACTAPCMTTILLKDATHVITDDRTSSVFPDYNSDTIWVGGAVGWLHKITGAFHGTPAEATTGGFPVQVNPSSPNSLSSPVYDTGSTNVFVGDLGGFLYRVSPAGVVTASAQIDHGTGIISGPIVDVTSGKVYVFSSSDGTSNCVSGTQPCTAVFQFPTNFAATSSGTEAVVGASALSPNPVYEGAFDSNYVASVNATGNLYVCGNTGGPPILYQVPVAAGVMKTPVAGPVISNTTTGCSPVTDVANPNATGGATEWLFAGVQTQGLGTSCASGGCAMNFKDTQWKANTSYVLGQQVLDSHFQIQTVRTAGTSGAVAPTWNTTVGLLTNDGATLKWVDQGLQAASHGSWQATHAYALNTVILDSNNNIQLVITSGTSKAGTHPVWATTIFTTTADNTVRWRNLGSVATASIAAAGGTSGMIIDNTVSSGTMAGASQVYFSTQGNQTCPTSGGTGGCAVQASQSALQ